MIPVLIVDDSPTVRMTLRGWLTEAGYETHEASDGLEALEFLRGADTPMVVLLDYQMPRLDGFETLSRAADEGLTPPRFAYVAISSIALSFPPTFSALLGRLGAQILPKPFERDALLHVTQFVERRLTTPAA
ncbi:MAG: response regulator [Chloroflexota bacterium]|nr:response regulator [Chloroflexota bacterium]